MEFVAQGNVVKATAIHAATGVEASIVGPANVGRDALGQAAVRKLTLRSAAMLQTRSKLSDNTRSNSCRTRFKPHE